MLAEEDQSSRDVTSALIIAINVCYSARLQDRQEFENMISEKFIPPLILSRGKEQFKEEITW